MTRLVERIKELNPFNIASSIRDQEVKDKRIARLNKVTDYVDARVEAKQNYLRQHTDRLVQTVKDALEDYDDFRGKTDE